MAGEKETWVEIDLDSAQEQERAQKVQATPQQQQTEVEQEVQVEPVKSEDQAELAGIETEGAKKRIQKLVAQKKAKEAEVAAERQRRLELEAELEALRKAGKESFKQDATAYAETLQTQLKLLEERYAAELEKGDAKAAAAIMSDMIRVNAQVSATKAAKQEVDEVDETPTRTQVTAARQAPATPSFHPKTQAFMEKHADWWGKDRVTTAAAVAIAQELEQDGYSPEEDDYYAEVENRLRQVMPAKFGGQPQRRAPRQTVSGVSGTPSSSGNRVRLDQSELAMAKRLGVSPEAYALQKKRAESAENGYTIIE